MDNKRISEIIDEEMIKVKAKKYDMLRKSLTIPKSIADELDGFNPNDGETKIAVLIEGYNECFISDELMQFCLVDNNLNLCALYLAGKALGVDLVKVGEG